MDVISSLSGKWYQIARSYKRYEKKFVEVLVYLPNIKDNICDLLYVGVNEDRSKDMKNLSLKLMHDDETISFVVKNRIFKRKFNVIFYDETDGFVVITDKRMRFFSIYSKKCSVKKSVVESYLSKLDFMKYNLKTINFYSNNIVD